MYIGIIWTIFLTRWAMLHARGPLRAMGDLVRGIFWSGFGA